MTSNEQTIMEARDYIARARSRIGDAAWRTIGPDLRQALACETMVRSLAAKDEDETSANQAQRFILIAQEIMHADFDI